MISETFVILLSIYYYLHVLSFFNSPGFFPSPSSRSVLRFIAYASGAGRAGFTLAVPGCPRGEAVQGMLFLPRSGYHIAWAKLTPAVMRRRLWGNSRLRLCWEISTGSGTELPQGLSHYAAEGKSPPGLS